MNGKVNQPQPIGVFYHLKNAGPLSAADFTFVL